MNKYRLTTRKTNKTRNQTRRRGGYVWKITSKPKSTRKTRSVKTSASKNSSAKTSSTKKNILTSYLPPVIN